MRLLLFLFGALAACSNSVPGTTKDTFGTNDDVDADTDTDTDADSDADTDSDTDTDSETGSGSGG